MTTVEDLINDVLVNLGKTPDELLIATVFDSLPDDVCRLAKEWGWCDTEVLDWPPESPDSWYHLS